jgi:hypothetical protein
MLLSKRNSFILAPGNGTTVIRLYLYSSQMTGFSFDLAGIPGFSIKDWHYYSATYDSSTGAAILYVDGVARANATVSGSLTPDSGPMGIGQDDGFSGRVFDGKLDDARVYSRVLSGSEMAALSGISSAARAMTIAIASVNDAPMAVVDTAIAVEAGGTANGTAGTNQRVTYSPMTPMLMLVTRRP